MIIFRPFCWFLGHVWTWARRPLVRCCERCNKHRIATWDEARMSRHT